MKEEKKWGYISRDHNLDFYIAEKIWGGFGHINADLMINNDHIPLIILPKAAANFERYVMNLLAEILETYGYVISKKKIKSNAEF